MRWRAALAGLIALAAWLNVPTPPAQARASLVQATPPVGAVLGTAPARVDLLFEQELEGDKSRIRVFDAGGARVDRNDLQVEGRSMSVGVRNVPPGAYRVRSVAVAEDTGGEARADYTFYVGPAGTNQPTLAVTPNRTDAGQTVTVVGGGFTPNTLVLLGIGDEQRFLASERADAQGRFSVQTLVPVYLPHGRQVIQALDLEQRMATAALRVERGGWPPLAVRVTAGEEEHHHGPAAAAHVNHLSVEILLINRSNWDLRLVNVRGAIPPGARLLRDEVEGPDDVSWRLQGDQIVWRNARVRAHRMVGPFSYILDLSGLPPGTPRPEPSVTVSFQHGTPPFFSDRVTVQATADE
jgi:methionine-rich copper-binding protein CopC